MKITQETELKYGMACRVCQEKTREEIDSDKKEYYIGCPWRCIDNEYCTTIENIEKGDNATIKLKKWQKLKAFIQEYRANEYAKLFLLKMKDIEEEQENEI